MIKSAILSSSATRARRYRQRRRDGVVAVVPITVNEIEIEALVRAGRLAPSDAADRDRIAYAVKMLLVRFAMTGYAS